MAERIVPCPAIVRGLPSYTEDGSDAGGGPARKADKPGPKYDLQRISHSRVMDLCLSSVRIACGHIERPCGELATARAVAKVATEEAEHWRAMAARYAQEVGRLQHSLKLAGGER